MGPSTRRPYISKRITPCHKLGAGGGSQSPRVASAANPFATNKPCVGQGLATGMPHGINEQRALFMHASDGDRMETEAYKPLRALDLDGSVGLLNRCAGSIPAEVAQAAEACHTPGSPTTKPLNFREAQVTFFNVLVCR
jgi:hypothetical protein